jgi:hypothetical protein
VYVHVYCTRVRIAIRTGILQYMYEYSSTLCTYTYVYYTCTYVRTVSVIIADASAFTLILAVCSHLLQTS